jgi:hypothetical protein
VLLVLAVLAGTLFFELVKLADEATSGQAVS